MTLEAYSNPRTVTCPKCKQEGFRLHYHGPGLGECRTPMLCRTDLDQVAWKDDPEHILMTCETCGFRVRKEIDYFENGE